MTIKSIKNQIQYNMMPLLQKLNDEDLQQKNGYIKNILKTKYHLKLESVWFKAHLKKIINKKMDNIILKVRH